MAPERLFEGLSRQRLQHRPQRVHHRCPLQIHPEMVIEVLTALFQKRDDTAVGPGSAQQRQHREHQQIRQRIPLALRPPRIGNVS
jgi:hypothetical protein